MGWDVMCVEADSYLVFIVRGEWVIGDVVDSILDCENIACDLILDIDDEFILQHHHNFNLIQTVQTERLEGTGDQKEKEGN